MKKIFLILVMTLGVFVSRAQQISVNTDVTMLMMQIYNAGAEMTIGNRSTLGLSVLGTKNPYIKKDMKLVAIQPEYRYYFGGRPLYHYFVGVSGLIVDYKSDIDGRHYDGVAAGAGLTFGYVVSITKRLTIDAHAGLGLMFFDQKKTVEGLPDLKTTLDTKMSEGYTGYGLMPTKIGVTLSYIIR